MRVGFAPAHPLSTAWYSVAAQAPQAEHMLSSTSGSIGATLVAARATIEVRDLALRKDSFPRGRVRPGKGEARARGSAARATGAIG